MSKTFKKLLASALAATMLFSTAVTALVSSAATTVGTISVGTDTVNVGDATATVDVTIDFGANAITAPHDLFTLTAPEGFTLTGATIAEDAVTYTTLPEGSAGVYIDPDDGDNLAAGKVLLEAPVDSKAPVVTKIVVTVTYAIADTVAAGTYDIAVDSEIADITEQDLVLDEVDGSIVVAEAHVCAPVTKYDETGHWTECECGEKTEVVAHVLGDYVANEDGTTETASCDCGYSVTRDIEVACDHANITYVSHVAPIEGGANGSITYTCDDCGETKTEEVLYDNTFRFATAYADYQAETILCFTFNTTDANWTGVDQTKSFAILTKDDNSVEGAAPIAKAQTISELTENGTLTSDVVMTYPLAAKELNDNVARQIIVYKDGKWYSRKVGNYSFVTYATTALTSVVDTEKTLIVDLLNYGTIAQTRFDYNTANPANATFGAYSGSTNEIVVENNTSTVNNKDRYRFNSVAASFESRAEMNFTITDTSTSRNPISDTSLVYVEVAYTDAEGNSQVKVITGDDFRVTEAGNVYVDFAELHATQMRQEVAVTLKATDDDSVQYVANYSIEYYVAANWDSATEGAICQALIRFGDSANAHFNK